MQLKKSACAAVVMAVLMAACAGPQQKAAGPEEQVLQRAEARWAALLDERWADAYEYFTPGHRSIEDPNSFQRRMQEKRVKWTGARVLGAQCPEAGICKAEVDVDYMIRKPLRGVEVHRGSKRWQENWLRSEGGWFYRPDS